MKVLRDLGLNINEDIFISGLTSSSGLIEKDQCFIALQGLRSHGLDYIDEAISNGASCVLHDKENYNENLRIIKNQIKQIGNLVNEFSDFARMPKPILKDHNIIDIFKDNIKLLNRIDDSIKIQLNTSSDKIIINSDKEQLGRVFFNLIKNSIESIQQKSEDNSHFDKKISIEINQNSNHINIIIIDNGIGFGIFAANIKDILNPYFTTKKDGTGLGLSIVSKIINDHNGKIEFIPIDDGAKVEIDFKIDGSWNINCWR